MLVLAFRGLPFWHRKSIQTSCLVETPSGPFLGLFHFDFMRKWSIWGPLLNPVGAKLCSKSSNWRKHGTKTVGMDLLKSVLEINCSFD